MNLSTLFKREKSLKSLDDSTWDEIYIVEVVKSRQTAWIVATAFGLLAGALAAVIVLMPAKIVEKPYMVRVNQTTGVVDLVTALDGEIEITPQEALDKQMLATFVKAYEGYHFYNLQAPYDLVAAMAGEKVGADYTEIYSGDNARDNVWRDRVSISIDILSVVPTGETGTVRFKKTVRKDGQVVESVHVATLSYGYFSTAKAKESVRLLNALGFRVMYYRVDDEVGSES